MKKNYRYFVLSVALMLPALTMAQMMRVPYFMGFEDNEAAELSNWVLNPGTQAASCADQWVVGAATHSAGQKSLYISADGGVNAQYGWSPNVQYVYRDFKLPAGSYDVSFEWKNIGSTSSYVSAGYANASSLSTIQALPTSATIPQLIRARLRAGASNLYGSDAWQNASFVLQSDGVNAVRVFFAWSNNNTDSASCTVGACIDNIQITSQNCHRPTDITVQVLSCDEVSVTWQGTSSGYEFYYRQVGTEHWHPASRVTTVGLTGTCRLDNMTEGSYDFRVRGICTPDTSAWTYYSGYVVHCPELHCVDFTDLYAPNVTCTYGVTNYQYSTDKNMAYQHIGVRDFGSDNKQSQHTVNWDKTATDPRTGGNLPLIPKGGYASVRLGNWETGNGAESVSYEYTVDSTKSVLLMQYAIVLECPSGHGEDAVPRFMLEVLDEQGRQLDPTCGVREFWAEEGRNGWESYTPAGSYYSEPIVYKPWTTIGLNLDELGVKDGDKIKVRLTTYDCFLSAHYGYAYFTLDCASATIETSSCAKDPTAGMTLKAPDGFKYQWYDKFDNPLPGETRADFTPHDTATYRCRLTSTEEETCYFDLYSQCMPRLPKPQFKAAYTPSECVNRVTVDNSSSVLAILKNDTINLDDKCDYYLWETWGADFPTLTSDRENPVFTYPQAGGTYFIRLTASLNGGCDESITQRIDIPEIGDWDAGVIDTTICEGSYIQWGETTITESGTFVVHTFSNAGCDSTATLNVTVAPRQTITLDTAYVCYGEDHYIGDHVYHGTKSGLHMARFVSVNGCDSTIMQYVVVPEPILPEITVTQIDVKAGVLFGQIEIAGSGYDYYMVNGVRDGELENLVPGSYRLQFLNDLACEKDTTIRISAGCIDALYTRWDNVLSLMNKESVPYTVDTLNYEFTDFQWYFNDRPIEGATLSYYEEKNGENGGFREGEYYLAMTRVATGERCKTCSFIPDNSAKVPRTLVTPTFTHSLAPITVKNMDDAVVEVYTMQGQKISTRSFNKGINILPAPAGAGIYMVNVRTCEGNTTVRISVQ